MHWLCRCSGLQDRQWTPVRPTDAVWHALCRAFFVVPIVSTNDRPVYPPCLLLLRPGWGSRFLLGHLGSPSLVPTICHLHLPKCAPQRAKNEWPPFLSFQLFQLLCDSYLWL